jgi:hypothetical protein
MLNQKQLGVEWSAEEVERRLVEALQLWQRSPGTGRWPFASDAPWHLMTRAARAEAGRVKGMELWRVLQEDDERETQQWQGRDRPLPLSRAQIALRDQASEWLALVPESERQIVVLATFDLARGRRVSWLAMRECVGVKLGADGLRRRYAKAIADLAGLLNARGVKAAA